MEGGLKRGGGSVFKLLNYSYAWANAAIGLAGTLTCSGHSVCLFAEHSSFKDLLTARRADTRVSWGCYCGQGPVVPDQGTAGRRVAQRWGHAAGVGGLLGPPANLLWSLCLLWKAHCLFFSFSSLSLSLSLSHSPSTQGW